MDKLLNFLIFSSCLLLSVSGISWFEVSDQSKETCLEDIGCIRTNSSWFDFTQRPINPDPYSRQTIGTTFTLHTKDVSAKEITAAEVTIDPFQPSKLTKIIIHGFLSDGQEPWVKDLTRDLLKHGDYNVIVVHWPGGSSIPYGQATANTRIVGLEIAHLVNTLVAKCRAKAEDFHIIGHSLGAHTAGYAGERIPRLGRITGLDPAGPLFEWMPAFIRLDATDAQFVDVVHTDGCAGGLGLLQPSGHLDFYPNGGEWQPGCLKISPFRKRSLDWIPGLETLTNYFSCSHTRATSLFTDSILADCQSVAYECSDYDSFLNGECVTCGEDNTKCSPFGLDASKYPVRSVTGVKLYMQTGTKAPFCKYHYAVELDVVGPKQPDINVYGQIDVTLEGSGGSISQGSTSLKKTQVMNPATMRLLYVDDVHVKEINHVKLYWYTNYNPLLHNKWICWSTECSSFNLFVKSTRVSVLNHYPEKNRIENSFKGCQKDRSHFCVMNSKDHCELNFSNSCHLRRFSEL